MLLGLQLEAKKVGLENQIYDKSRNRQVNLQGQQVERVHLCVSLGQKITLGKSNQEVEINRRILLLWATYGRMRHVFSSNFLLKLKTKVYLECILPV